MEEMPLDYRNKLVLAPMVRVSTLPNRLLCLDYGADIVYCEELIDFKIVNCQRVENALLGSVDYVWTDGTIVFRTVPRERPHLVFQLGTSDAQRALKVGKMIEKDVAALDINMGCPKEFSIKGGMGAALLSQPEKIKEILTTLVQNLSIPVTCKIRILPQLEDTLSLARMIEKTGVAAIAVHGRTRDERPRHDNHDDIVAEVAKAVRIPVIANGGSKCIKCHSDMMSFRESCSASSVMVGRAAQWNPSVFRLQGVLPVEEVVKKLFFYSVVYDNSSANTKYCAQQMLHEQLQKEKGKKLLAASTLRSMCEVFDMAEFYDKTVAEREANESDMSAVRYAQSFKRRRLNDGSHLILSEVRYNRKEFQHNHLSPKLILYEWTLQENLPPPKYTSVQNNEKMFWSDVEVDAKKYASSLWDKSKKCGEQAAAVVCLRALGLDPHSKANNAKVTLKESLTKLDVAMAAPVEEMENKSEVAGKMEDKNDIGTSDAGSVKS